MGDDEYGGYSVHPAAELFPKLEGKAFDELVEDIKANGLLEPVETIFGTDQILDGRNRARACVKAGVNIRANPVALHGQYEDSPYRYVISKNLRRRHLTKGQAAAVATEAKPEIEREIHDAANRARARAANERRDVGTGKLQSREEPDQSEQVFASTGDDDPQLRLPYTASPQRDDKRVNTEVAQMFGLSGETLRQFEKLKKNRPDLAEKVAEGKKSVNAAFKTMQGGGTQRQSQDPAERARKYVQFLVDYISPPDLIDIIRDVDHDFLEDLSQIFALQGQEQE